MPGAQETISDALWKVRIDTGGTFTDALGIDPEGRMHRRKVLSTGRLRARAEAGGLYVVINVITARLVCLFKDKAPIKIVLKLYVVLSQSLNPSLASSHSLECPAN